MTLLLTYTADTKIPVELDGIVPDRLRELQLREIERLPIQRGNQQVALADLFRVTGDAADGRIELVGNLAGIHGIGAGMLSGEIRVAGAAGRHVGQQMRGGKIVVEGDAGDWLGSELRGGLIQVRGRAGDHAGAALPGSRRGITGGTILIDGAAGSEVGYKMRRGLIAIGGECGPLAGMNLIAGTILVFGPCGPRPGAGMRRGTLALLGGAPPLLPSFRAGPVCQPVFLRLVLKQLASIGFKADASLLSAKYQMHHGDLLEGGRGEVLVRAD